MNIDALKLAVSRFATNDLSGYVTAERRDVLAIFSGFLIAHKMALPTSPVTELTNYYVTTVEPSTMAILDNINDEHFVNIRLAADIARNVYLFRYNMVYDTDLSLRLSEVVFSSGVAALPPTVAGVFEKMSPEAMAKVRQYLSE